jgi:hypothetical protein
VGSISWHGISFSVIFLISTISFASGLTDVAKQAGKAAEKPKGIGGRIENAAESAAGKDKSIRRFGEADKITSQKGLAEIDSKTNQLTVELKNPAGDFMKFPDIKLSKFIDESEKISNVEPVFDTATRSVKIKITGTKPGLDGKALNFTKFIEGEGRLHAQQIESVDLKLVSSLVEDPVSKKSILVSIKDWHTVQVRVNGGDPVSIYPVQAATFGGEYGKLISVGASLDDSTVVIRQANSIDTLTDVYKIEDHKAHATWVSKAIKQDFGRDFSQKVGVQITKGAETASEAQAMRGLNINTNGSSGQH